MTKIKQTVRIYQGVAYFPSFETARDFGSEFARGFSAWRVVGYQRGFAVQTRPSGDYLGPDGRPSMETVMRNFDRA